MLQALVHFSLRFKGIVSALACLLIAYGIYATIHAKQDVFPDFVPPEIGVCSSRNEGDGATICSSCVIFRLVFIAQ